MSISGGSWFTDDLEIERDHDDKTQPVGGRGDIDQQTQIVNNQIPNVLLGPFPSFGIGETKPRDSDSTHSNLSNSSKSSARTQKDEPIDLPSGETDVVSDPDPVAVQPGPESNVTQKLSSMGPSSDEPVGSPSPIALKEGIDGVSRYRRYSGPVSPIRGEAANAIARFNSSPGGFESDHEETMNDRDIGGNFVATGLGASQATQLIDTANYESSPLFKGHKSSQGVVLNFEELASSPLKVRNASVTSTQNDVNVVNNGVGNGIGNFGAIGEGSKQSNASSAEDDSIHIHTAFFAAEDSQLQKRRKAINKLKNQEDTAIQIDDEDVVHLNIDKAKSTRDSQDKPGTVKADKPDILSLDVDPSPSHISDSIQGSQGASSATQIITGVKYSQITRNTATANSQFQETQRVRLPNAIPNALLISRDQWMSTVDDSDNNDSQERGFTHPASLNTQGSGRNSQPVITQVLGTPRQEMRDREREKSFKAASSSSKEEDIDMEEAITSDHEEKNVDKEDEEEEKGPEEIITSSPEKYDDETPVRRGRGRSKRKIEVETPVVSRFKKPRTGNAELQPMLGEMHTDIQGGVSASNDRMAQNDSTPDGDNEAEWESEQQKDTDVQSDAVYTNESDQIVTSKRTYAKHIVPSPTTGSTEKSVENVVWGVWGTKTWYAVKLVDTTANGLFEQGGANTGTLSVRFGNGDVTDLTTDKIRRFDIQVGDKVKLDNDRRPNFEVVELLQRPPVDGSVDETVVTTTTSPDGAWVGYEGVCFVKVQHTKTNKQTTVPIRLLYMSGTQISSYLSRRQLHKNAFQDGSNTLAASLRQQSKALERLTLTNNTSQSSNQFNQFTAIDSGGAKTQPTDHGVAQRGILSDCVFTISAIDNTKELEALTKTIIRNGGVVLNGGLQELFSVDYSTLEIKYNHTRNNFTFGGVLAKFAVRTPKYLEGLALGWPCLSFKFIIDSIAEGEMIQDWEPYLLSAGVSSALDQAYCSYNVRHFHQNWLEGATLADQFINRRLILGRNSILADRIYLHNPDSKDTAILFLLVAMAPQDKLELVNSRAEVPSGSVLIDMGRKPSTTSQASTSRPQLTQLRSGTSTTNHPKTIIYNREWIIQCLINQRIV
ncbi:chromatin-binding protein RAD9 [Sugiyamaella lignohabitans]|uniref:Chromatin-binding protein RAD9 n=1 Tax=Sugiyamaella lignohabitans TaxID=796027 RepID=A0A161HKR0_9ASCO|nr:chromatin-binding protein RAD9 [Sugiyamaella lignohabitans]ANB13677.1 chromatin-binding protein RAD9 [Sugiyamaella lignohabitans]